MRIISFFLLGSILWNSDGFIIKIRNSPVRVRNMIVSSQLTNKSQIMTKIIELSKLTRIQSTFIPVSMITFLGSYVTNPNSWQIWIHSPPFWAAYFIIQSMTAASMTINDIQDMEVDRINNPNRPLIRGTITKREAQLFVCSLYSIISFLGIYFLPPILDPFWTSSLFLITIYTPILKRICFIKNLTCATIIASTIPFMGFVTLNPSNMVLPDLHWMLFTTGILFETSMYNELLLDISDKEGDEIMNIPTVPVVFGKKTTAVIIFSILQFSYGLCAMDVFNRNNPVITASLLITHVPFSINLARVWQDDFDKKTIRHSVKFTTISLFFYLLIVLFSVK